MDKYLTKREYRIRRVVELKDTAAHWDHIAAAVEAANIENHNLKGAKAQQMKGRSKITFQSKEVNTLQSAEKQPGNSELVTRAKWLRRTAGQHAELGNKLITTARRMKAASSIARDEEEGARNKTLNRKTIHSYIMLAADQATTTQPQR